MDEMCMVRSVECCFGWREHDSFPHFSAEVGGGERVVLFLYTNLHCMSENMLFWGACELLASVRRRRGSPWSRREPVCLSCLPCFA